MFKLTTTGLLLLIAWFFAPRAHSQNFVPNPDFEYYWTCPFSFSQIWFAEPWEDPAINNLGSTDYYNTCSGDGQGEPCQTCVPTNTMGYQEPLSGDGYGGFWCYNPFAFNQINECMQVELDFTLQAGVEYDVRFHVSLGENSQWAIDQLGMHFSNTAVTVGNMMNLEAHVESPSGVFLVDQENWMLIEGTYVAEGGEQFITIGNLHPFEETNAIEMQGGIYGGAYYYVEDVFVGFYDDSPPIEIVGDTVVCAGDELELTALNAEQWEWWDISNLDEVLGTDSVYVDYPVSNNMYFFSDGETTITHFVEVLPLPNVNLGEDVSLCEGESITLEANESFDFWEWGNGTFDQSVEITQSGTYWLNAVQNNCWASDSIDVLFLEEPVLNLPPDIELCTGDVFVLDANVNDDSYSYNWSNGEEGAQIEIGEEGEYAVVVSNGVCETSAASYVSLINCASSLVVSNIFTPNDDAFNKTWMPIEMVNITALNTQIFNRWGEEVFASDSLDEFWDGSGPSGSVVADGTYYYVIRAEDLLGEAWTLSGTVMVVR